MTRYILSEDADRDLDEIWDYIAADDVDAADRWISKLFDAFEAIGNAPGIGHKRNVDFPEPLGPIRPIRSASETEKETSSRSGFAPKPFEMCCALMIGGNGDGSWRFQGYQETETDA